MFDEIVAESFHTNSINEKDHAIKRFSNFWRLVGEIYRNDNTDSSSAGSKLIFNFIIFNYFLKKK